MEKMTQEDRIKHYAHLIQRQTGKAVRPYRADGYINMVNRYGTSKDSSEQYSFVPEAAVPDEVLELHYENNGLFSKIIDMPAEEAVKHGFTIEGVEDGKLADFYSEALDELNWEETAMTAVKWARLFGGSIAVMLVNDGRGLEEPLDWKNIQSIDDIRVYDRSLIQPDYSSVFNYDPQDPFRVRGSRLGMPEYYDVFSRYGSFRVHDSRCLVFQNGVLPENASNTIYQFWGIPEYIRLNKAIRDADVAHRSAPKLLERSVQPIYKMKDLASELATEQGEDRVLKRLQVIDTARGILNSLVIDADGEDYDFKTFQYNGITDVISASCNMLAALSNIPQIILFGQTISGMSNTDDTSMENYYNYIERIQKRMLRSNLRYLLSVVFQAGLATGEVDEIPKLKVQFNPLWSVSDSEQAALDQQKAQTEQVKAQTAQIYVGMEAIDPSEVRSKLADSDEFDVESMLDEYTDEEIEAGMPGNGEEQEQPADGQPAAPDSQPSGNDEKGGPGQLLNEKTLTSVRNGAKNSAVMEAKVSSDPHENKEGTEGDEPASAPAATKQPADMDPEEKAKAAQSHQIKAKDREDALHTDDNNSHPESQKGSVGVIVVNGGRILNGTRHNDFGYGLVCGPGGHIEEGETPEQAAFRETKEEFGIMPKSLTWLGQGPEEKDTGLKPYLFLCTEYYGTPNCEDLEMTGAKFSTIEELNEKAESMFGPFADGLNILMDCLETGIFYTDPAEGVSDEKLNSHLEKAMNSDGGPGSGNFNHGGRPGKVGGSAPSDESGSNTSSSGSAESITQKLRTLTTGEIVYAQNLMYDIDDIFKKSYKDDDEWISDMTGEVISTAELLDPKNYAAVKTSREIHDEKYDLSPKFKTKAAYLKAKDDAISSSRDVLEQIDRDYLEDRKKIEDKYGDRFELRSKILNDASLSDEEREQKLNDLDFAFQKKNRELAILSADYDDIKEPYLVEAKKIFEPEYEYKKISSVHTIDDDCNADTINPEHLESNCQRCAIAFELRQRGYDVQASDGEHDDLGQQRNINACFLNPDIGVVESPSSHDVTDDVVAKMEEWGDYSRAVLCVDYVDAGHGHAVNLCNIGGNVYYIDSQSGEKHPIGSWSYGSDRIKDVDVAYVIRTDNARLSADTAKYVKERAE